MQSTGFPRRVRDSARYLFLPAMALGAAAIAVGPRVWPALRDYYSVCQVYVERVSMWGGLPALGAMLAATALVAAGAAAIREMMRLRRLTQCLKEADQSPHATVDGIPVSLTGDRQPYAFCHGLFDPHIYVSAGLVRLLTPAESQAVLLHEAAHARRYDPLRVFIANALAAAFLGLPVGGAICHRYLSRLEIEADRRAVQKVGVGPLAAALAKLLGTLPAANPATAVPGFHPTQARIQALANPEGPLAMPLVPMHLLLSSAGIVLGTVLLTILASNMATAAVAWASPCPTQIS